MNRTSKKTIRRTAVVITSAFLILMFSLSAKAQAEQEKMPERAKRVQSLAAVRGNVGGESHDSYMIKARKGQTLRIQISWQSADNNKAEFVVSRSADFSAGETVEGGKETLDGRNWTGKVPASADYYIFVTAHPAAKYKLRVSVK